MGVLTEWTVDGSNGGGPLATVGLGTAMDFCRTCLVSNNSSVEIVTGIYQHIPVLYIIVYYCAYIIYCLSTIIK